MLPLAMGAVVDGVPITFQTPLSGHFSPVRAVAPIGALLLVCIFVFSFLVLVVKKMALSYFV